LLEMTLVQGRTMRLVRELTQRQRLLALLVSDGMVRQSLQRRSRGQHRLHPLLAADHLMG